MPPAVSVPVPRTTEPSPAIAPTASSKLLRSNVAPVEMVTEVSSDHLSIAPSFKVPSEIVVAPENVLAPLTTRVPEPAFVNLVPTPVTAPEYGLPLEFVPPWVSDTKPPERARLPDPRRTPEVATSVTPPVEVRRIRALRTMSRVALSVSVLAPPAEISADTVMSPDMDPSPSVLTTTLPLAKAVAMVAALMFAAVLPDVTVDVNVPLELLALESSLEVMVISRGSMSQVPGRLFEATASVSTRTSSTASLGADVSTFPPLPNRRPPRETISPRASTNARGSVGLAQSTTVPPLPSSRALASMRERGAITMRCAARRFPEPCHFPPRNTSPPPALPLARIRPPDSIPTSSAPIEIEPAR